MGCVGCLESMARCLRARRDARWDLAEEAVQACESKNERQVIRVTRRPIVGALLLIANIVVGGCRSSPKTVRPRHLLSKAEVQEKADVVWRKLMRVLPESVSAELEALPDKGYSLVSLRKGGYWRVVLGKEVQVEAETVVEALGPPEAKYEGVWLQDVSPYTLKALTEPRRGTVLTYCRGQIKFFAVPAGKSVQTVIMITTSRTPRQPPFVEAKHFRDTSPIMVLWDTSAGGFCVETANR